jgi:glucose-6-phosphate isomerase
MAEGSGSDRAAGTAGPRAAAGLAYRQSVEGCLESAIGVAGLTRALLDEMLKALEPHLQRLREGASAEAAAVLAVPDAIADMEATETALASLAKGAETIVFFGTGGSSLGGQTLAQLAGWNIPGDAGRERRKGPRTRFYDNLDPRTLERALATLDLARTRFVVVSKSGGTPETLAQALAAIGAVREAGLGGEIRRLFLGLTEPVRSGIVNPLRDLCTHLAIPALDHDPNVGGRFSALTNVGVLPALTRGLDVRALRAGAREVVADMRSAKSAAEIAPALGAAAIVALMRHRGVRNVVMLPYADRLESFGAWHAQLWAESLGKSGQGSQPVAALGPLDQHSQLQLWLDGPREHLVTVLRTPSAGIGPRLDAELARRAGLDYLAGRALGDLVAAQSHAIPDALARAQRPVRTFDIPALDERAVGALMMHMMIETILAAGLLGVDPFGQPAVELGKRLTRERLAR